MAGHHRQCPVTGMTARDAHKQGEISSFMDSTTGVQDRLLYGFHHRGPGSAPLWIPPQGSRTSSFVDSTTGVQDRLLRGFHHRGPAAAGLEPVQKRCLTIYKKYKKAMADVDFFPHNYLECQVVMTFDSQMPY